MENNFINKSQLIHKNVYDYSLVIYKNNRTKVKIICPVHGVFEQTPKNHLRRCGCQKCSSYKKSGKNLTNNIFVERSIKKHDGKYDYSLIKYINNYTKVKIICPVHGIFEQTPYHHYNGNGCQKCSNDFKTNIDFLEKSNQIHDSKYNYSLVNYINTNTKVKIICPVHGIFEQQPKHHYNGSGCPMCKNSKGETFISNFLKEENITFSRQKKFLDCKNIYPLPFDFYLPMINICIEYDGEQHFKPMEIWGGEKEFNLIRIRDSIKTKYCIENNIKLVRIKYDENKLEKLKNELK
jgi:hypothetical protein